jgi:hypothetical protein
VANYLWLLNDGSSRILLNNGTDKLALNEEVPAEAYGWQPPLGEPSRHIRRAIAAVAALAGVVAPASIPSPGNADVAFTSPSNQVVNKTVIYEDRPSYAAVPAAAETVTVDKWYAPLNTPPVRRKFVLQTEGAYSYYIAPTPYAPSTTSGQIFRQTILGDDLSYAWFTPAAAETVTVDKWYAPLATPVRRRVLTDPQEYAQAPHTPFAIAWAKALDTPVRRRFVVAEEGSIFGAPPKPEANDAIGWHRALDTPVRRKFTWYGDYGYGNFLPHTNDARWYAPLATPVRRKTAPYTEYGYGYYPVAAFAPGNADLAFTSTTNQVVNRTIVYEPATTYSQAIAGVTLTPYSPSTTSSQFFRQTVICDDLAYAWFTPTGETVTVDKWWRQLDVPVRRKPPADKAALTFVAAAPGNGNAYNWFLPLEIPTRARKLNEYPATSIPVYFVPPTPGSGLEYNWWSQLDEPIRPRRSIGAARQQSVAVPSRLLTTTLEYAWYQPLTTPTRLKLAFGQYPAVVQGNITPVVPTAWYPLHAPLRTKHRFNHEATASPAYQIELVTMDKWWRELARPIYTKRIDRPALTQSNIFPVVPIAWQQLHAPLRLKGRINYPAIAQGNINPVVPYAWHPLHAPHRQKGRIDYPAHLRALYPVNFPGTGVGTNQPWPALSEPVRFSPRLRPGQQQFLSHYPLLLSSDLDPACRILTPDAMYVTLAGEADTAVVPEAQTTVVADEDEDTVTPENQDNIIVVKC